MEVHRFLIGELNVNLVNDKGVNVPLQVNDNEDGSFLIDYVPTSSGVHNLNCTYGGVKVPDCPIKINVQSPVDLSKVKVDGLETRKFKKNLSVRRHSDDRILRSVSMNILKCCPRILELLDNLFTVGLLLKYPNGGFRYGH